MMLSADEYLPLILLRDMQRVFHPCELYVGQTEKFFPSKFSSYNIKKSFFLLSLILSRVINVAIPRLPDMSNSKILSSYFKAEYSL